MIRWIPLLLALLLPALVTLERASGEPDEELLDELITADEIRALHRDTTWQAFQARMAGVDEAHLGRLLDRCVAKDTPASRSVRRAVSHALSWKVLDRRVASLRAQAPTDAALATAPRLDVLSYPATDGSTSTIPLERLIACRVLGSPYVWGAPARYREQRAPFRRPTRGSLFVPEGSCPASHCSPGSPSATSWPTTRPRAESGWRASSTTSS